MRKCTVLLLVACLVVSSFSVLAVSSVSAQAGFKPSVPQFTVKLIDSSYDVPPIYTTDPYTGEPTTKPGYRIENYTIEISIKNQPFTPYTDKSDYYTRYYDIYYSIRVKGHFGEDWYSLRTRYTTQSDSEYTVVSHSLTDDTELRNLVAGSKLDFSVQAYSGYWFDQREGSMGVIADYVYVFDAESGWSNIQSITIPNGSSPSQTATLPSVTSDGSNSLPQSPDQTQPPNSIFSNPLFIFGVGALFAGVVIAVVMVIVRKHLKTSTSGGEGLYA